MITAILIDDEPDALECLQWELENFKDEIRVAATFNNAHNAIEFLQKNETDFLQKPTDSAAIKECINKIKNFKNEHLFINYFEEKLYRKAEKEGHKKIIINTDGKLMFLQPDEIIYCESDGNYSTIYLENEKKILISTPLKQLEEKLTDDFFRIHHSYIINMNKVQEYLKNDSYVILSNNIKIPVSRQKKSSFLDRF